MSKLATISVPDLGGYLREQRQQAQLSLRQLADAAGISNPYLSQIERGLKHPSAEILQALARGLRISAESLYIRAGLLEESVAGASDGHGGEPGTDVRAAIRFDSRLTERQRTVLLDVYESFVDASSPSAHAATSAAVVALPARRAHRRGGRSKAPTATEAQPTTEQLTTEQLTTEQPTDMKTTTEEGKTS